MPSTALFLRKSEKQETIIWSWILETIKRMRYSLFINIKIYDNNILKYL